MDIAQFCEKLSLAKARVDAKTLPLTLLQQDTISYGFIINYGTLDSIHADATQLGWKMIIH